MLTNAGGRPGDALVLTKPLGAGAVVDGGQARARATTRSIARAIEVMATLNRDARGAPRARPAPTR